MEHVRHYVDAFLPGRRPFLFRPFFPCCLVVCANESDALGRTRVLLDELGWKYYGGKHYESIYTRFYGYVLPKKLGFDKRRSHLSSLICSGEKTRDEAVRELESDGYPADLQQADLEYVLKKFGISAADFESIMDTPPKSFWDYPSYARLAHSRPYRILRNTYRTVRGKPLAASVPAG